MDCIFLVGGQNVTVAISLAGLAQLQESEQRQLTDQQLADIAALFLRRMLEAGNDPSQAELFLDRTALQALAKHLGYL